MSAVLEIRKMAMDEEVRCNSYCKSLKPLWKFRQDPRQPNGHKSACRECESNKRKRKAVLQKHKWDIEEGLWN